jgi:hypothetical protein
MEKLVISLFSAALGFFFSQFFNLVGYLRRPKFKIANHGDGVLSFYCGSPPEAPWEIELGFFLDNKGRNPAKNIRIFVSELCVWDADKKCFEETLLGYSELRRPVDILPSGQNIRVLLGRILGDDCSLRIDFKDELNEDDAAFLSSDTRFQTRFRAKTFIFCDDPNSSTSTILEFNPSADEEWGKVFFADYEDIEFRRSIVMPSPSGLRALR